MNTIFPVPLRLNFWD